MEQSLLDLNSWFMVVIEFKDVLQILNSFLNNVRFSYNIEKMFISLPIK